MTYKTLNALIVLFSLLLFSPSTELAAQDRITWQSWEKGLLLAKKENKPLLIKIYRQGCGWCKQMDRSTFNEDKIVDYVVDKYIPVILPVDEKQELTYKSKNYNFTKSGGQGYHELALDLAGGRFGTPGLVFMDENMDVLQSLIGYKDPQKFLAILKYYGDKHYLKVPWHKFNSVYVKE